MAHSSRKYMREYMRTYRVRKAVETAQRHVDKALEEWLTMTETAGEVVDAVFSELRKCKEEFFTLE